MAYYHGVKTRQVETSVSTPVTAASGISFVVGTAPVHTVDGEVNAPVLSYTYNEAAATLGYGDNWDKYGLCEVMYSHYKLYGIAPVIFVNVLDPKKHKKTNEPAGYAVTEKRVLLPFEAVKDSVKIGEYKIGEDYDLFYDENNLIIEILDGGAIPENLTELSVEFDEIDPSKVTAADIIGGFNVVTKKTTGLELIDAVFPKYGVVPDIIICPGWSHDAEVAAIMSAKAENINGVFEGKALIDIDTSEVRHYTDAVEWKKINNINAKTQILCYPMCMLGGRLFHMSTQMAGLMAKVDANNGCPAESPSNKLMQINGAVLADGTEILLDIQQANYLNSNGIVTAINFIGGFVLWGNETACFPSNTDVKDYFISVSRMFGWVANSVVLSYWSKIDKKFTRRLIDSIIDSLNIWLNGLAAEEKLLGGHVEFRDEENNLVSMMGGKAVFHIYLTPPSPAKEIEFILEYDPDYVSKSLI